MHTSSTNAADRVRESNHGSGGLRTSPSEQRHAIMAASDRFKRTVSIDLHADHEQGSGGGSQNRRVVNMAEVATMGTLANEARARKISDMYEMMRDEKLSAGTFFLGSFLLYIHAVRITYRPTLFERNSDTHVHTRV
jgi:hypothetical protein